MESQPLEDKENLESSYKCSVCKKVFKVRGSLTNHQKTHKSRRSSASLLRELQTLSEPTLNERLESIKEDSTPPKKRTFLSEVGIPNETLQTLENSPKPGMFG